MQHRSCRRTGGPDLVVSFGTSSDRMMPGDYDGDKKIDIPLFRPSDGNWYVKPSVGGPDLVTCSALPLMAPSELRDLVHRETPPFVGVPLAIFHRVPAHHPAT